MSGSAEDKVAYGTTLSLAATSWHLAINLRQQVNTKNKNRPSWADDIVIWKAEDHTIKLLSHVNINTKWGVISWFWTLNKDALEHRQSDVHHPSLIITALAQCLGLLPLPSPTA